MNSAGGKGKRESFEEVKRRTRIVISRLKREYPEARCALSHESPHELLISTILSAQCTDERVNLVTKELFEKYRSAKDFATANQHELERDIRATGFFRAKAKNIINCCKALVEKRGGKVPNTMEELIQLAGVGRKTANVVLGTAFGIADGIVVDTHVRRLSQRLGFSDHENPEKIEQDLMQIIPKKDWIDIGHLLIWHGRKICNARKPRCSECPVKELCPSAVMFLLKVNLAKA